MKLLLRLRPLIRLFGVRLDKDLRQRAEDLEQEFERLASMPDRFNDLFADRGWIAYEQLNQELMEQAVELGEAGDIEAAEEALVEHFDEDRIVWGIKFLWASPDFRPRERLARLALEDYLAERYHACIPVLLLIIDGFVNDVTKSKGFFAEGTEMLAWDSIAAHDRGLMHLARLWNRGRNRTSTEPLTIPYRNGILHGRDLAYDQKIVAAKLWAALFALRSWAILMRDGKTEKPPDKPPTTWSELAEMQQASEREKRALEAWHPRTQDEIDAIPRSGQPDDYQADTPEETLARFASYWQSENYGYLARLPHLPFDGPPDRRSIGKGAKRMRELLDGRSLVRFEILEIQDLAPAITTIKASFGTEEQGVRKSQETTLRFIYGDEEGRPMPRSLPGGSWTIMNLWWI